MNHAAIAQALLQLTGSLKPTGYTTASDLEQARTALAQTLLHGLIPDQLFSESLSGPARSSAIHSAIFEDTTHSQIQALAKAVVEAHDPATAPIQFATLTPLSILAVELLPGDDLGKTDFRHPPKLKSQDPEAEFSAVGVVDRVGNDPLGSGLGSRRILRTSALTPVPPIC